MMDIVQDESRGEAEKYGREEAQSESEGLTVRVKELMCHSQIGVNNVGGKGEDGNEPMLWDQGERNGQNWRDGDGTRVRAGVVMGEGELTKKGEIRVDGF